MATERVTEAIAAALVCFLDLLPLRSLIGSILSYLSDHQFSQLFPCLAFSCGFPEKRLQ